MATITSNGKTFPGNVTFSNINTKTLSGNWTITGTLTLTGPTGVINRTTAETLSCAGITAVTQSGTITIILTGGTWSGSAALTFAGLQFSGNVTVSGSVRYEAGTITYNSGTVTTTGSTWTISTVSTTTVNTNGITWNNITVGSSGAMSLSSLLSATGTMTISNAPTFSGAAGWTVGTLSFTSTTATTTTLTQGNTYTITTSITGTTAGSAAKPVIVSSDGTLKVILTLNNGASCTIGNISFTRIDASGGRAINTWNGTVTTCNNVFSFTDALTPAIGRVIHAGASY